MTIWTPTEHPAAIMRREREQVQPRYGGDLFTAGHAWRSGRCKWCGARRSAIAESAICPGKPR